MECPPFIQRVRSVMKTSSIFCLRDMPATMTKWNLWMSILLLRRLGANYYLQAAGESSRRKWNQSRKAHKTCANRCWLAWSAGKPYKRQAQCCFQALSEKHQATVLKIWRIVSQLRARTVVAGPKKMHQIIIINLLVMMITTDSQFRKMLTSHSTWLKVRYQSTSRKETAPFLLAMGVIEVWWWRLIWRVVIMGLEALEKTCSILNE